MTVPQRSRWSWSLRTRVPTALLALLLAAPAGALTPDAHASISCATNDEVTQFLNLLVDFSNTEHLLISNDKQMNATRVVKRRTLVLDDGTRFVVENFSNPDVFELHIIVQGDGTDWKAMWGRLIDKITANVASGKVLVTDR